MSNTALAAPTKFQMSTLSSLNGQSALLDLSSRTKLQFKGNDRIRFLNGQVTNDVRKLETSPDKSIYACVLTTKGKMCADVFISAHDDALIVDADSTLQDTLLARFERYIIADDVEVEDVSEQLGLFHLVGPITDQLSNIKNSKHVAFALMSERFRQPGIDLFFPKSALSPFKEELIQAYGLQFLDADATEAFRIQLGVPRWGKELDENTIPIEAGLEAQTIDYTKGCYMGQEVISRLKSLGHVNRHLRSLKAVAVEKPFEPGFTLQVTTKEVGKITSVTSDAILGYVHRLYDKAEQRFDVIEPSTHEQVGEVELRH